MDTRTIGSLEVSVIGLGGNNFGGRADEKATEAVIAAALECGINFFDTADVYADTKSEVLLGKYLRAHRDEVLIATKFGIPYGEHRGGASPDYVREAVEESLRRLDTDRIDLYQLHFPDKDVPVADTLGALNDLVVAGKVREIGCSNFTAELLEEAHDAVPDGAARFVSVQNQFSILHREPEPEVLAKCEELDIAFLPYFPLASGLLTGKYRAGEPVPEGTRLAGLAPEQAERTLSEKNLGKVAALTELAGAEGHSVLDLAVAWLLSHRVVASVIAGATRPEQVRANAATAGWTLSPELLAAVDALAPA